MNIIIRDLQKVAARLGISEEDVIRRCLIIMGHYSQAIQSNPTDTKLLLKQGGQEKELLVMGTTRV